MASSTHWWTEEANGRADAVPPSERPPPQKTYCITTSSDSGRRRRPRMSFSIYVCAKKQHTHHIETDIKLVVAIAASQLAGRLAGRTLGRRLAKNSRLIWQKAKRKESEEAPNGCRWREGGRRPPSSVSLTALFRRPRSPLIGRSERRVARNFSRVLSELRFILY